MGASDVSERSMADVLGARARRTLVDRLVLDVGGGLLIGAAAVLGVAAYVTLLFAVPGLALGPIKS